jgi:hypothetical protein
MRFIIFVFILFVQITVSAQDGCANLLVLADPQAELTYTVFDKKGKETAHVKTKVVLVEETKIGTIFYFESSSRPEKGPDENHTSTYYVRCFKDTLYLSMQGVLPPGMLESYQSMDMKMEATDLVLPRNIAENAELPDGTLLVAVSSNGMKILNLKAQTTKRKVEKKETITVAAGTFSCTKVLQTTEVKIGFISNRTTCAIWYAEGAGMIKQETYDKKGKVESTMILQQIVH